MIEHPLKVSGKISTEIIEDRIELGKRLIRQRVRGRKKREA